MSLKSLVLNPNPQGWGPTTVPEQYVGIPFAPYSKSERLGRVADYLNPGGGWYPGGGGKYQKNHHHHHQNNNIDETQEEEIFELVDTVKSKNASSSNNNNNNNNNNNSRGRGGMNGRGGRNNRSGINAPREEDLNTPESRAKLQRGGGGNVRGGRFQKRGNRRTDEVRENSVRVLSSWKVVEQFDLSQFSKMTMAVPKAKDLAWCGNLYPYNAEFDRVSTKNPKKLQRSTDTNFFYVTTLEDPVLEKYIEAKEGNVFCTDELMAHLMTCGRSQLPWDIIFTRVDKMLFIDKRDESNLELVTVNETAFEPKYEVENKAPPMPFNDPEKLRIEATAINQNFLCQVLNQTGKPMKNYENPNPFGDDDDGENAGKPAPIAYRYRKWTLGENTLVSRTELHGIAKRGVEEQSVNIYAMNEWDSKLANSLNWRQKIDNQRGAVLATELKNNSAKIARWTAQSLLSGADLLLFGYVSRLSPKDPLNHQVLATQFYNPKDFAVQINLSQNNMWGVLKSLIDFMMKQPGGKYIMLRDPSKPIVKIYSIPMDSFEDDAAQGDEEEVIEEDDDDEIEEEEEEEEFDEEEQDDDIDEHQGLKIADVTADGLNLRKNDE